MRLFLLTALLMVSALGGYTIQFLYAEQASMNQKAKWETRLSELSERLSACRTENILLREKAKFNHLSTSIITCESSGRENAHNPFTDDYGLFQINRKWHSTKMEQLGLYIEDPIDSYIYGLYLLRTTGTKPWKASQHCWSVLLKKEETPS